ncbi:MAG: F420-dependent methylenetetrahydromethanopterin dehydrogenase [Methermicoccaceae archaeon]
MAKIGFVKLGNLGTSQGIELLLDEIAQREGIDVRVFGTGAKMGEPQAEQSAELKAWGPDFVIIISPNAMAPGPTKAREIWSDVPTIVMSDGPTKKDDRKALEDAGFGYIILPMDPLIGAKRQFLDPVEMVSFNSDALKVLSLTGASQLVREELDNVIAQVDAGKSGKELELPHILATPEKCAERMRFTNPYAKAKAIAACHIASKVPDLTFKACFVYKDIEAIVSAAAAGHEMIRAAARLADESRELEKAGDTVARMPHAKSGATLFKQKLYQKPE